MVAGRRKEGRKAATAAAVGLKAAAAAPLPPSDFLSDDIARAPERGRERAREPCGGGGVGVGLAKGRLLFMPYNSLLLLLPLLLLLLFSLSPLDIWARDRERGMGRPRLKREREWDRNNIEQGKSGWSDGWSGFSKGERAAGRLPVRPSCEIPARHARSRFFAPTTDEGGRRGRAE